MYDKVFLLLCILKKKGIKKEKGREGLEMKKKGEGKC